MVHELCRILLWYVHKLHVWRVNVKLHQPAAATATAAAAAARRPDRNNIVARCCETGRAAHARITHSTVWP